MQKVIGIDLGTTNSVVAVFEGNTPQIVPNNRGGRLTPSVVAFSKEGEILVGQAAKNQAIINSSRTISSIKRAMGTKNQITIDAKKYSPEEISALILRKLKKDAEEYLGCDVKQAVITVPSYFNDAQRQATINAGKIAGIEVLRIVNEPTAAALAYGLKDTEEQIVMVYDIGGGTYDVSILEIGNGVFQVLATSGNNHLGGDDLDQRLLNYVIEEYKKKEKLDLKQDRMALQRLLEEVEKAKIELSESPITQLSIPFITATEKGPRHLEMKISRSLFENLIKDLVEAIEEPAKIALKDAKLSVDQIDKVLLVGGTTRIPVFQDKIAQITKKELYKNINPDECVALGAAIQSAIIKGTTKGIVLVDVIPMALGIEVEGGGFVPIIDRNTPIPVSKTKLFTTISDDQEMVEVKIYQGERKLAIANKFLGNFQLTGIRNSRKGEPRVEVTFDVDVDGILHVSAKDLDTNVKQTIIIKDASGLSPEEIKHMVEEANRYEEQDRQWLMKLNLTNKAEGLLLEGNDLLFLCQEKDLTESHASLLIDLKEALGELQKYKEREDMENLGAMVETTQSILQQFDDVRERPGAESIGVDINGDEKVKIEKNGDPSLSPEDLEILEQKE